MSIAANLFMNIDGIEGAVTDSAYPKWLSISDFEYGAHLEGHIDNTSNNLIKGGAWLDPISFSKDMDSTSTQLSMSVKEGTIYKKVIIAVGVDVDNGKKEISRWTFEDCLFNRYQVSIAGAGAGFQERLTFLFSNVTFETNFLTADKSQTKQGPVFWNVKTNSKEQ